MENLFSRALSRAELKERRRAAINRRAYVAPLVLERLKEQLVVPTLSFASLPEEIDMSYVNAYLQRQGLLILPRIQGDQLILHKVVSELVPNSLGILEPVKSDPLASPKLALIPGLAFDQKGGRIGYGKGYYDRLLSRLEVLKIGIAFEEQEFPTLPQKAHDKAVDKVFLF